MEKYLFKVYENWKYTFDELSNEKAGMLIKLIFEYHDGAEIAIKDETLRVAFAPIKKDLDREHEKREHISRVRSKAGRMGGLQSGQTRKRRPVQKDKNTEFKPPTLEEVKEYCLEKNNGIDPEKFISYYKSIDWKVGKTNKKMTDWKSTIDYWVTQNSEKRKPDKSAAVYQGEFKKTLKSIV